MATALPPPPPVNETGSAVWQDWFFKLRQVVQGVIGNGVIPPEYADDTAAAAGGLPVGGLYKTGSILKIRVT